MVVVEMRQAGAVDNTTRILQLLQIPDQERSVGESRELKHLMMGASKAILIAPTTSRRQQERQELERVVTSIATALQPLGDRLPPIFTVNISAGSAISVTIPAQGRKVSEPNYPVRISSLTKRAQATFPQLPSAIGDQQRFWASPKELLRELGVAGRTGNARQTLEHLGIGIRRARVAASTNGHQQ